MSNYKIMCGDRIVGHIKSNDSVEKLKSLGFNIINDVIYTTKLSDNEKFKKM